MRRHGPSRIVKVDGTRETEVTPTGAVQVGTNAPDRRAVRRAARPEGSRVGTVVTGDAAAGVRSGTTRNRRPGGQVNTGRKAVPRPLASSPLYGNSGRGQSLQTYRGGRSRHVYPSYYGYRRPYRWYGRNTHIRYPHYARPHYYGSFFYFPGYGFNVGVGLGYPAVYGYNGYSGYAYHPYTYGYGYGGYNSYGYGDRYADPYTGYLRLKVKPRDAQVFVDGYYVGLVDHFDGFAQRLRLEEGTHRIEIQHPNYAPIEFEVLIVVGEKVTFEERMIRR